MVTIVGANSDVPRAKTRGPAHPEFRAHRDLDRPTSGKQKNYLGRFSWQVRCVFTACHSLLMMLYAQVSRIDPSAIT